MREFVGFNGTPSPGIMKPSWNTKVDLQIVWKNGSMQDTVPALYEERTAGKQFVIVC
jgi:hypothetical protein